MIEKLVIPREQELLLKVVSYSDERSLAAWDAWKLEYSIDDVLFPVYRLLPTVFKTLSSLGLDDSEMKILRGIYRNNFTKCQYLFRDIRQFLVELQNANIDSALLKGSAAATGYYEDASSRVMYDFDLLIKPATATRTIEILLKNNWKASEPYWSIEDGLKYHHSVAFRNENGTELDLHWHLLHEFPSSEIDELYWEHNYLADFQGLPIYLPEPTEIFFHTCVHGLRGEPLNFYWIIDAIYIGKKVNWQLDWDRLLHLGRTGTVSTALAKALLHLHEQMQMPIPVEIIKRAEKVSPRTLEKLRITLQHHNINGPSGGLLHRVYEYLRFCGDGRLSVFGFFTYLKESWGVENWCDMPLFTFKKIILVLKRWIEGSLGKSRGSK